jgi:hypothetical protein
MFKRSFYGVLAAALLLLGSALPAAAQGSTTTGQIRGRVLGDQGQALAAVVVTARNTETGLERSATTGSEGLYVIRLLPPGIYDVRTDMIGFAQSTTAGIRVIVGQASPVNFELTTQAIELEGIEVMAERPPIDVADGGVTQFVGLEEISELPALGRDFTDFINLSGLVAPDPGETTGGQFSIAGMRASQTSLQIDGVDANNSFFGENRGGSRLPFTFSLESIREFQIISSGFDVEHGSYGGGIVNVVTRGGTNEFKGSVYANYRGDALTSAPFIQDPDNPEITTEYQVQQFAGTVSGPIIRDKAFFHLSVNGQRRREPQLPITRGRFAPGGAEPDPVVYDEIAEYFSILENKYGIANPEAGYQPFETTNDQIVVFGRVDWELNQDHRLSVRHNYTDFSNDNEFNSNFDFQYGLSRAELLSGTTHSFVTELQSVLGDNTFNVFRFQFANEKRPRQGKDLRPALSVNLSSGERIRYGGTFASFNNNLEETKLQLINNFTHALGDHTFKLGGNFLATNYLNRFMNFGSQFQGAGEFVFADLDAFEAGQPSSYFRPIQEGGGIPTSEFDVWDWSIYAQDEWQLTPKLRATVGIRYAQQSFRDSPTPVVDAERAFGFQTGFAPTDSDNISPRLSLTYDLKGDGTQVVRGGIGYFYGIVPGVLGGNVLQTERPVLEVVCNGSVIDGDPDAPPSPLGYGGWDISGFENPASCASQAAGGVPTYTFWNENFEVPEHFKANLGYETLLGDRTQLSVDFMFSQSNNLYTVRNLNLRPAQFNLAGEGGRRIFTPAVQFDPTTANSTASRRNLEFGDVFVNYTDGRARSFNLVVEGNHRVNEGMTLRGSYTFTRAYENSNYSCCTASGGYYDPTTGAYGPNEIGEYGDTERAWGRSDFSRDHTFIGTVFADLPFDIRLSAFWRSQSGRPWTVRGDDDLNGDGLTGNDRLFIFKPENLPLASTGEAAAEERDLYRKILNDNPCVGDHQGGIIERNTCRFPWQHQLDVGLTKSFQTTGDQRFELQVEVFNVMNAIGRALCDEKGKTTEQLTSGICGLGRITGIYGSDRELLDPRGFDSATGQILYEVNDSFGEEGLLGDNLVLQFQAQIGLRYYF